MTPCESVNGTWGRPCPDCGAVLPRRPKQLRSWKAERHAGETWMVNPPSADHPMRRSNDGRRRAA